MTQINKLFEVEVGRLAKKKEQRKNTCRLEVWVEIENNVDIKEIDKISYVSHCNVLLSGQGEIS